MSKASLTLATTALAASLAPLAQAGDTLIGDFRIGANDSPTITAYDPGFGPFTTRGVTDAPVQVNSQFTGTSQNPGDATAGSDDIELQTYSAATHVRTMNRFAVSDTLPRVGAIQWNFDLTPLDSYLATNTLQLDALDFGFNINSSNGGSGTQFYDFYVSYTDPTAGITLTDISDDDAGFNHDTFWAPSQSAAEGDFVNGSHKVVQLDFGGTDDFESSLLDAYNNGAREFNVIVVTDDFTSGRRLRIFGDNLPEGRYSGLTISTSPLIPEPGSMALLAAGGVLLLNRRRK